MHRQNITRGYFKTFHLILVALIASFPCRLQALEPVTVAAITNTLHSVFSKNINDPYNNIIRANRELLIGVHDRLDGIEQGLASALAKLDALPAEVFKQSLKAQEYGLGSRVLSHGLVYLDRVEILRRDGDIYSKTSEHYSFVAEQHKKYVIQAICDLEVLGTDLSRRRKTTDLNALSIVAAAYIETALLVDYFENHGGSRNHVAVRADRYIEFLQSILENNRPGSLGRLIGDLKLKFAREMSSLNKISKNTIADFNGVYAGVNFVAPTVNTGDPVAKVLQQYHGTYEIGCKQQHGPPRLHNGPPGNSYLATYENSYRGIAEFRPETQYGSGMLELVVDIVRTQSLDSACEKMGNASNQQIRGRLAEEFSATSQRLLSLANTLVVLNQVRDMVSEALNRLIQVKRGDFSAIGLADVRRVSAFEIDTVSAKIAEIESAEEKAKTAEIVEQMAKRREQIKKAIASQDKDIREAFAKAADAAQHNRTLGYLQLAASIYELYYSAERELTKEDRTYLAEAVYRVEEGVGRDPANIGSLLKLILQTTADGIKFWGSARNTKMQLDKMNDRRCKIGRSLPNGTTREFNIVVRGTEFRYFEPTDVKSLRAAGEYTLGKEIILSADQQKNCP